MNLRKSLIKPLLSSTPISYGTEDSKNERKRTRIDSLHVESAPTLVIATPQSVKSASSPLQDFDRGYGNELIGHILSFSTSKEIAAFRGTDHQLYASIVKLMKDDFNFYFRFHSDKFNCLISKLDDLISTAIPHHA